MYAPLDLASRSISFRPDQHVMVVRWHTHADLEAVQADYAATLDAAEASGFTDWLLDVRRRDKARPELSAWVSQAFCTDAVARMAPRRLRMAVLTSPALAELYRNDPAHRQHVAYATDPARPYDVQLFADEGQAMNWLCPALR